MGYPAYVLKINPHKNTVMIGDKSGLEATEMFVLDYRFINLNDLNAEEPILVKIRYRTSSIKAKIEILD